MNGLIICQREWFDKHYGNTYFTCRAIIFENDTVSNITVPFQYGHGRDVAISATMRAVEDLTGVLPWGLPTNTHPIYESALNRHGITVTFDTVEVARRKDMHRVGRSQKPEWEGFKP